MAADEPPWMPNEAIVTILKHVVTLREENGNQWLKEVTELIETLDQMDVSEANNLFNRLSSAPAYLNTSQRKELSKQINKVELRLNQVKIEWLVAKYYELEESLREEFLRQINAPVKKPRNSK